MAGHRIWPISLAPPLIELYTVCHAFKKLICIKATKVIQTRE